MPVFTLNSVPLFASRARCTSTPNGLEVEADSMIYTFSGRSAALLERALPVLDGSWTVLNIATEIGTTPQEIAAILASFDEEPLVLDLARAEIAQSGQEFVDALEYECKFWSKEIFRRPFWNTVLSGAASRQTILGWGIEFYHFVDSANEYMAAGVANCREGTAVREWLVRHYVEECNHGVLFLEGLGACGLDTEQVIAAPPLASTRALINYLYELAISNSFSYAAAFAVMQPSRKRADRLQIDSFYDPLIRFYPFATGMFQAFRKHALIDVELKHNEIVLDRMCEHIPTRVLENGPEILKAARGLVEQFMLFFEGIGDYYSQPLSPVPRRALISTALL